jgi:hypothetical protein
MKMNTKAFGLNYVPSLANLPAHLKLEANDLLIIGYDIAPAERLTPADKAARARNWEKMGISKDEIAKIQSVHPAMVAVCANKSKDPFAFSGNFFFQLSNDDLVSLDELAKEIELAVAAACKAGRKPTRLLVFRDGISEGRQDVVATKELEAIRRGYYAGVKRDPVRNQILSKY